MQQTILAERAFCQQVIKDKDDVLSQIQRQNLSLKASIRNAENSRLKGLELLRFSVGLLLEAGVTVPNEIAEYLGKS